MDLPATLPALTLTPYSHILPSLSRHLITTADLLTLPADVIAKRTRVPVAEVAKLAKDVISGLHGSLEAQGIPTDYSIPSGIKEVDELLSGGVRKGCVTEIVGESGTGKTLLSLHLLLSAVSSIPQQSALYLTTSAPLPTSRLLSLMHEGQNKNVLDHIHTLSLPDLESQNHILSYQLPLAVKRYGVSLIVIDAVPDNYHAPLPTTTAAAAINTPETLKERSTGLLRLASALRRIAIEDNVAIVCINHVGDRMPTVDRPGRRRVLSLDHQLRWFSGWGDDTGELLEQSGKWKTPSLGLVWSSCVDARIALKKRMVGEGLDGWVGKRTMKVVWGGWCEPQDLDFEITESGLRIRT